jgi:hypothetical protein
MTRSHVLLHSKIRAAREEAWEGKDPDSVRVLLSNPRWERRLLRLITFLLLFLPLNQIVIVMGDSSPESCA